MTTKLNLSWSRWVRRAVQAAVGVGSACVLTVAMAQTSLIGQAVIDGVGSLIDPSNGGQCASNGNFGCSRDVVRLQSWAMRSAGVFQVYNDGSCGFVRISGLPSANIMIKAWDEAYPGQRYRGGGTGGIYRANSLPANMPVPGGWSLVHVSSLSPLSGAVDVQLQCQSGGFFQLSTGQISVTASSTSLSDGSGTFLGATYDEYFAAWGGNGSLITFSNNRAAPDVAAGFGRNVDIANTYGLSLFSTVLFQGYSGGSTCRNVRVSSNKSGTIAEIRVKEWSQRNWNYVAGSPAPSQYGYRTVSLPFVVPMPGGEYTLIKVDPFTNGTAPESITAACL
jgi:hypothetical protein